MVDVIQIMKLKTLVLLLAIFCGGVLSSFAQNQSLNIDVESIGKMSVEEFQAYQKVIKSQASNASHVPDVNKLTEYAIVGKALGQAFKECWSTVSVDAEKFAQSPAGKWTAFLITWKVMGRDAFDIVKESVRWTIGTCMFFIITPVFFYFTWRNCISKNKILEIEQTGFCKKKVKFETTTGEYRNGPIHGDWIFGYGICYALFLGIIGMIMFVG